MTTNETENKLVATVRGLVRPVITFLVILALVVVLVVLAFRYADAVMAKDIVIAFLTLVASITGFWFGSRKNGESG
ncbi:MAG: hypothetical protein WC329_01555 [Candidatus Omnitrophota bacterium]|jgi:uncharacterized membrane protein YqjE